MPLLTTALTVLPPTDLGPARGETPVLSAYVDLGLDPRVLRGGKLMLVQSFRYQHIRADAEVIRALYGVDVQAIQSLSWTSTGVVSLGEQWTGVAYLQTGLFSDFQGLGRNDLQFSFGSTATRPVGSWVLGAGVTGFQRPDGALVLPLVLASRPGERVSVDMALPSSLKVTAHLGPVDVGAKNTLLAGTYHLYSAPEDPTFTSFVTLTGGPFLSYRHEDWELEAWGGWIGYRRFTLSTPSGDSDYNPDRGWAGGLRLRYALPTLSEGRG